MDSSVTDDMLHVTGWFIGNQESALFSNAEMSLRQDDVRRWISENDVEASPPTMEPIIGPADSTAILGRKSRVVIDQYKLRREHHRSDVRTLAQHLERARFYVTLRLKSYAKGL